MTLLTASNVRKTYRLGRVDVPVLHGVDLAVRRGEWLAVLGKSGSGKSTLLHLLGGLDRVDRNNGGVISYEGSPISELGARGLNRYRNQSVGFVFQFYHLLPELNVLENTLSAAMIRGRIGGREREHATELLGLFDMAHRLKHRPNELSGGERQRVALARALVNRPTLLLADEPTGNLDQQTGASILDVLARLHDEGQTIVMVTHDPTVAERADRRMRLVDGLVADTDEA
jgi:ABC-type lipoprotein export system ATPase subunit